MGRRRQKDQQLPRGVRPIGARLFWQPPTKRERAERKAQGLPASAPLGAVVRVRGRIELTKHQREQWAQLAGYEDAPQVPGTVAELLKLYERPGPDGRAPIEYRANGLPLAKNTVRSYRHCLLAVREKFGACRYGKTEFDAARGQALGSADVQRFINASGSYASQRLSVLSNAFNNGIREGFTTYNPCDKVVPPAQVARGRAPLEWEVEVLGALAQPVVALILEGKLVSGYRISELLRVHRRDMTADGIRMHVKGGRTELLLWSPRMRAIATAAEALPTASRFPASPLFPHSRGKAYSYSGWYAAWVALLDEANELLAAGVVDPDTRETLAAGLSIEDLNVHDVRSKVHDDAEDLGREGHEQLGNTEKVANRHYARREKRRRPIDL